MTHRLVRRATLFIIPGLLLVCDNGQVARGQVFNIDTAQSSVTVSGSSLGVLLKEQGPGSLTTHYSGTIRTEIDATSIRFPGDSHITAEDSGSWEPKADASAGSEPANYGAMANAFVASGKAAVRNMLLDVDSESSIPLINGQFDAHSLAFRFPTNATSVASYLVTGFVNDSRAEPLAGYWTNGITTEGTLETIGDQQKLTLKVDFTITFKLLTDNDTTASLKGQIVATRSVGAPLVVLQPPQISSQGVNLQWQSDPGQIFKVEASGDLNGWQTAADNITSATGDYSWSEPIGTGNRFYRLTK